MATSASNRASFTGSVPIGLAVEPKPRAASAASMPAISVFSSFATFFSQAPTTAAAVPSRACVSGSSPASRSTARRADSTSASVAACASANPSLQRRHDSANAVGQLRSRLPRISTANVPARRRLPSPDAIRLRIALRKASKVALSAISCGERFRTTGDGGSRLQKRAGVVRTLISRLRRRSTICCTRPRSAGFRSLVCEKRTGSRISSSPLKQRVWPLCGVALRNSRCSNLGAMTRSIRHRSLSSPNADGIRLWHSSTISRSQGRCGDPSGGFDAARNCSSTSSCRK